MDDPNGLTRVGPAMKAPVREPPPTPDDHLLEEVRRAAGAEYDVLGPVCEVGDAGAGGTAYLAQPRSGERLDVLRLARSAEYAEVLGTVGEALHAAGDLCPTCGAKIRAGVRFCGSCRANLGTLPVSREPGAMSVAEWLEAKGEAARQGIELLGRIDDRRVRDIRRVPAGAMVLAGRVTSTATIVALLLERSATGSPSVLGLDQTSVLATVVESLFDVPATPARPVVSAHVVPPLELPIAPPTLFSPEPVRVPPPPPPSRPRDPEETARLFRMAALVLGTVAVMALVVWVASTITARNAARDAQLALLTARADSVRRDSLAADSARRAAAAADSVTVTFNASLPAGTAILVDGADVAVGSLRLGSGSHTFAASAPGYRPVKQTMSLRPGQALTWPARLVAISKPSDVSATTRPAGCADAARRGEWKRALDACARDASTARGNALAERTLGTMYQRGLGVPVNPSVAAVWYSSSAAHGDREGQYLYASLLQSGGMRRNRAEAAAWFLKAAEQGHAEAQVALATMYANGDGVPRSDDDARQWFRKAASQGSARARDELARRHW